MDIAKRLIDYGFHPYTTAFPADRSRRHDDRTDRVRIQGRMRSVYRCDEVNRHRSRFHARTREDRSAQHTRPSPRRSRRRAETDPALDAGPETQQRCRLGRLTLSILVAVILSIAFCTRTRAGRSALTRLFLLIVRLFPHCRTSIRESHTPFALHLIQWRQAKTEAGLSEMSFSLDAWLPKSVILLRDYNLQKFFSDLIAGITVGLVALPLAMAFAIASGVPPQAGIYCAIVTGFLISALGGSRTQIGGPTGAFVVVVLGIISRYGLSGLSPARCSPESSLSLWASPAWARS